MASDEYAVIVEKNVPIKTRDGVVLRSDVYRPVGEERCPVLLGRTHYGKDAWGEWIDPPRTAGQGYVVVVNDMRGQFASEGEFDPFRTDIDDSYDVVEWCAAQPWSDGNVGMFGSSSGGFVQLLAAVSQPPHLVAIAPMQTWSSFGRGNVYDPGGGYTMLQWWALLQANIDPEHRLGEDRADYERLRVAAARAQHEISAWYRHLPLTDFPPLPRELAPWYHRWLEHPDDDEYWATLDVTTQYQRIRTPALHLVGWFDRFSVGSLRNYAGILERGATPEARAHAKLVIGPWPHGVPVRTTSGDRHFGPAASVDARALVLRWYDHWLKGIDTGMLDEPAVRLYVLGEEVWRDEAQWPPARARSTSFYLRSGGHANTRAGDGVLDTDPPGAEPADAYVYDPGDPTPSVAGRVARPDGPADQGPIEDREDVLVFSTPPLTEDVEVSGPVVARLWASSSAADTDWVVKLCDVFPDGYVMRLCDGMIRARYRHSQSRPAPLEPGRVEEYRIDLLPTSNLFRRGHRIRVEVASANFPAFDRNTNTGNPLGADRAGVPAIQHLHHDAERPSHIVLPIIPR
jgi:uncharacterized protein